jgi:YegS/Rv2252/BmrU family lipid kinase
MTSGATTPRQVSVERALVIANPAARRGHRRAGEAMRALASLGVQCELYLTERVGHAADLAREHGERYDAVFSVGGDGTAMEVIGALSPDGPPVGILPGGTGNLLARALGIPLHVHAAARALVHGDEARLDLGRFAETGYPFAIGTGVGIDAAMIASTPPEWKQRLGILSYVLTGTAHALRHHRFRVRVRVDDLTVERDASAVLVANFGVLVSGLITLGDGIRYDDGMLDVCIFDPVNMAGAVRIARRMVFRDFRSDPGMTYLRGRVITVETDPPLPAQADGELTGTTPLSIVTDPLAARVLVPHCRENRQ